MICRPAWCLLCACVCVYLSKHDKYVSLSAEAFVPVFSALTDLKQMFNKVQVCTVHRAHLRP